LTNTAKSYEAKGDYRTANIVHDETIKAYPDYEGAYVNKGVNFTRQGKYKEAIEIYKLGLKNVSESLFLNYNLGLSYYQIEQLDSAIFFFTSALPFSKKCEPIPQYVYIRIVDPTENTVESSEILYERGLCYYDLNKYNECIADMKTCIECRYRFAASHYMVGASLYALGNEIEGCEEFVIAAENGDALAQEEINLRCK
jgi:tetratricopeptide (TPR) repeat protein